MSPEDEKWLADIRQHRDHAPPCAACRVVRMLDAATAKAAQLEERVAMAERDAQESKARLARVGDTIRAAMGRDLYTPKTEALRDLLVDLGFDAG